MEKASRKETKIVTDVKPPVSFVAIMPGPRNGMTLMTERILREMEARYDVRLYDIGKTFQKPGTGWVFKKAWRSFCSALAIAAWKPRSDERLYLVLNATSGLYYNILQAAAGRLRSFKMVAHHHVWSYLSEHDWRMSLLIRILGKSAVHVVACPEMAAALQKTYPRELQFSYLTPSIIGECRNQASEESKAAPKESMVIGTLSNLTIEKGVGEVIDTFAELRKRGLDVRLILAGPAASKEAGTRIRAAVAEFGDRIDVRGPVYGKDKERFLDEIDLFLFPTRYRNESWGIVLNEALMAGVPVCTYRRGCTAYLVGSSGGMVVTEDGKFVGSVSDQIEHWIKSPAVFADARLRASQRGRELRDEAELLLREFLNQFAPPLKT